MERFNLNPPIRSRLVEPFLEDPWSYSRLSTWLSCGWQGHQKYDLGFDSGTEASHNIKGKAVHETCERLHLSADIWSLNLKQTIQLAHSILDKQWERRLGGKHEVKFLKGYSAHLQSIYDQINRDRIKAGWEKSKAPWMTKAYKTKYKPMLAGKERIINEMMRRMNYVEFEPLPAVFNQTYQFVESYCRIMHQDFYEPEELYLEYEDDPLVTFEGAIPKSLDYVVPFRGAIDQIWFYKSARTEEIYLYDIKTSRSGFTVDKVRYHDQLFLYALHIYQTYGKLPSRLGIIDLKNATLVDIEPTQQDLDGFVERFEMKIRRNLMMKEHKFYPPAAGDSQSLCGFCDIGNNGFCRWWEPTTPNYTPNMQPKLVKENFNEL